MVTPISEIVFSGFVSKIVNNGVDASWTKIKKVIKSKSAEHQSTESQVYSIIVNALNQVTYNKYENNQDKVYQAAEKLLLGYNDAKIDDIEILRSGLRILDEHVDNDRYIEFKRLIFDEIGKKENVELYHSILLWLLDQKNKYDQLVMEQLNQKLDVVLQILGTKEKELNIQHGDDVKGKIKSRTQEYADKWESNMFLNDFDKRDENAGINVKLNEVYLEEYLPHYIWGGGKNSRDDLKELLKEYIYPHNDDKMLVILGQPGIGKSTLITWILANFSDRADDIFVYRFASDLGDIEWSKDRLSRRILEKLGFKHNDLNGKTLILDGLDEVSIDNRREVLESLYGDLIYGHHTEKFSLIITCRENYVQEIGRVKSEYIILQPWDETQIKSFCNIFQVNTEDNMSESTMKKLIENRDILGIPLILYMTLALNITIEKEGSIVDIYDKIFSLDGGIYDRCINSKSFAHRHRISEMKEQIHQISRDIAMWMFENNPNKASIPQKEYEKICDGVMEKHGENHESLKQDAKIGNFFKTIKHCEGIETEEICFVHRSIYEYFVAETIYSSIENAMIRLSDISQIELAKNIAFYLKKGEITSTIGEYLQHKIINLYKRMNDEKKQGFYIWWENVVDIMMEKGMFYFTNRNIRDYEDIIDKESNCFCNLMEILRLLLVTTNRKYIMESVNVSRLLDYITLKRSRHNISRVCLKGVDLKGFKLHEFDLREANLCNANLERVDLIGANLQKTDLQEANLMGAVFSPEALGKAILKGAKFDKWQITELEKCDFDLREINIFMGKKDGFISYEDYCKKRKRKVNLYSGGRKTRIRKN